MNVTRILSAIEQGDPQASEQQLPLVYRLPCRRGDGDSPTAIPNDTVTSWNLAQYRGAHGELVACCAGGLDCSYLFVNWPSGGLAELARTALRRHLAGNRAAQIMARKERTQAALGGQADGRLFVAGRGGRPGHYTDEGQEGGGHRLPGRRDGQTALGVSLSLRLRRSSQPRQAVFDRAQDHPRSRWRPRLQSRQHGAAPLSRRKIRHADLEA